jgi:uncharacterized Rmd1/YagE family protein|tara:strand:- start:320 stop:448 length:129 start_codon:yes stop_codon:yes gene_type:complete
MGDLIMTKELLEILKKLRRYIEIQSDRIDILNKRLEQLERNK